MQYVLSRSGRVFAVRWLHTTASAVAEVETAAMAMHRSIGQPLLHITVVAGDAKPPSDEARRELLESSKRLSSVADKMYLVLEGTGFRLSMMRSVVAGLMLMMESRKILGVFVSIDEALRALRGTDRFDERTARAALERDGIIGALAEQNVED